MANFELILFYFKDSDYKNIISHSKKFFLEIST